MACLGAMAQSIVLVSIVAWLTCRQQQARTETVLLLKIRETAAARHNLTDLSVVAHTTARDFNSG